MNTPTFFVESEKSSRCFRVLRECGRTYFIRTLWAIISIESFEFYKSSIIFDMIKVCKHLIKGEEIDPNTP